MLATHARRPAARPARAADRMENVGVRRARRRGLTLGFTSRRLLLHLLCLGLVYLAATGPLAALSSVGSRSDVAEAVRHHTRLMAARAEAEAPGGWNTPGMSLTIAEINASNPPDLALPSVPPSFIQTAPAVAAASSNASVAASAAPVAPAKRNAEAASQALRQQFSTLSEAYGIVVLDADGTPVFEHRATAQFQAASLYKLGVAAEVYRQERAGRIRLKDPMIITRESLADGDTLFTGRDIGRKITIGEAVDYMITRSSNVAAILLLKRLGPYNVNDMFEELGLTETRLLDRPFRNIQGNAKNQTTPRDIARFFDLLLHGKVVDVESSQAIIKLLLRQKIDDRLPAALPKGVPVAHKTGNLVGVVHDAGIIYSPAGPLIVVGMSQDVPSEEEAYDTLSQLARVAYDAYVEAERP